MLVYSKIRAAIGVQKAVISGGGSLAPHLDTFYETIGLPVLNGWGLSVRVVAENTAQFRNSRCLLVYSCLLLAPHLNTFYKFTRLPALNSWGRPVCCIWTMGVRELHGINVHMCFC